MKTFELTGCDTNCIILGKEKLIAHVVDLIYAHVQNSNLNGFKLNVTRANLILIIIDRKDPHLRRGKWKKTLIHLVGLVARELSQIRATGTHGITALGVHLRVLHVDLV